MKVRRLKKRLTNDKPLSAYTTDDWYVFMANYYLRFYGSKMPGYPNFKASCSLISTKIYKLAFFDLLWSASDFSKFIINEILYRRNKQQEFSLFLLSKSGSKQRFIEFDNKLKEIRKDNLFERFIYIPHQPFSSTQDDLIGILEFYENNPIAMCYNYGLPIFHAYQQIQKNRTFIESTNDTRLVLSSILKQFKNNQQIANNIFNGIARNSILWEPCTTKTIKAESKFVLNWREEFEPLWNKAKENSWWKDLFSTKSQPLIKPSKCMFDKLIKMRKNKN